MRFFECFTASIAAQKKAAPELDPNSHTIYAFRRSKWFSLGNPLVMQADPFLFVHNDTLFVFYEQLRLSDECGKIMMISTKDLKSFTKPVQITNEPDCHFSYPFVFEDNGNVYMMPETGCDFNIRLYRATDSTLTKFEPYKVILSRTDTEKNSVTFDLADSCIHKKEGTYYLFTSYYVDNTYFLELYQSDKLRGPYTKHPSSPICKGNKYGRCGGCIIESDGHLFRPAQDCGPQYGDQVHLLEIDKLSPEEYSEHSVRDNVLPKNQRKYKVGGHHLTFAEFKGQTIVATDSKHYCTLIVVRILSKLKAYYKG